MMRFINRGIQYVILLSVILCVSCTRNNGDIGEYFGTWKLESMTVNGEIDAEYEGNIFWKFQASVFCMVKVWEHHDYESSWGTWKELDGKLVIDYRHYDDNHEAGSDIYAPNIETHLVADINELTIISMSGSKMSLSYVDENGDTIIYKLKKW